ncbi:methyl-accepting chemotaxis protein [Rhodanobacter aciditrophus]|uniref:Methyl-accepting chemotaxis protein n=1 Tax=Rhodanobacter aciditrophus TaxID=1623218 RepID=A0ABW4B3L3_9GAMM
MLIKQKLALNTCVVLVSMLALIIVLFFAEAHLEDLIDGKELSQRQESEMLLLRRHEKDFLAREDLKYLKQFDDVAERIVQQQQKLNVMFGTLGVQASEFSDLEELFVEYRRLFNGVVDATVQMGLNQDEGLEGDLRSAVHDIESSLKAFNQDALLVTMLQLRRHEKDFMLRLDMKYLERFKSTLTRLKDQLRSASIPADSKQSLLSLADSYQDKFSVYVNQQQAIGLTSNDGQMGVMRRTIQQTESKLALMTEAMEQRTDELLNQIRMLMLVVFALIVVSAGLIAWRISQSISRPLDIIRRAMLEIDQTRNLGTRVAYEGKDEIGEVSKSINQMLEGFQSVVQSVNNTVVNMTDQTQLLSKTAARTAHDADRQRDETDMVAASVAEMVGTVEEISRNMEHAADKATATQDSAADGQAKVSSAIEHIHSLASRLEGSMSTADALAKESESIGTVLNVIQDIAEQTNLLALNAAIEAARAGEQGRGFAVVADEVRALASRTHTATVEISEIIESLQSRTKSMVALINECRDEGLKSRDEAAITGDVLSKIIREVDDIAHMAGSVASAIEEQTVAANEISKNVESIRAITSDTSESVALNSQSSAAIAQQANDLKQAVSVFKL